MKKFKKIICIILVCILSLCFVNDDKISSKSIIEKMNIATENIHTLRYNLHAIERVNENFMEATTEIKLNVEPSKVYLKNPKKKLEVLYVKGENNNNALVNTGKFILPILNLNPNNGLMRKNQHHTLDDLGFSYFMKIISKNFPSNPELCEKTFINLGIVEYKNHACHKIFYKNKNFKYINYTVQKNETIRSISDKFGCGDYRIIEKNPTLSYGENLQEGSIISVPNGYGINTLIYIDTTLNLPIGIVTSDDKGLYESYIFSEIIVNSTFEAGEFEKNFEGYHF